jgi:primosomal protein N' (replication factor Y)
MRMKTLRAGVTRLREELAALLGVEVGEVSGAKGAGDDVPAAPVLVGTEAVLHRVRRASAVAFLDIDLHLLAPRFSAIDETLALLARASRLVGPRRGPAWARVLVQTRVPDQPVLVAVARGEPAAIFAAEESMRASAGLPPFSALAAVSGSLAHGYVEALRQAGAGRAVTFSELAEDRYLVQAPGHRELCDLLAAVPRPPGRGLRVEVDPAAL